MFEQINNQSINSKRGKTWTTESAGPSCHEDGTRHDTTGINRHLLRPL